ncbi:hypothetical protein ACHQDA_01420 [Vibrio fluvialis]|uniref:hypothetical protein n=1 Tax=Vibrio fluvialis TaxID=676 RepID=UPI0037565225
MTLNDLMPAVKRYQVVEAMAGVYPNSQASSKTTASSTANALSSGLMSVLPPLGG